MGLNDFSMLLQTAIIKQVHKAYGLEIFLVGLFSKSLTLLSEKHQCKTANGDSLCPSAQGTCLGHVRKVRSRVKCAMLQQASASLMAPGRLLVLMCIGIEAVLVCAGIEWGLGNGKGT